MPSRLLAQSRSLGSGRTDLHGLPPGGGLGRSRSLRQDLARRSGVRPAPGPGQPARQRGDAGGRSACRRRDALRLPAGGAFGQRAEQGPVGPEGGALGLYHPQHPELSASRRQGGRLGSCRKALPPVLQAAGRDDAPARHRPHGQHGARSGASRDAAAGSRRRPRPAQAQARHPQPQMPEAHVRLPGRGRAGQRCEAQVPSHAHGPPGGRPAGRGWKRRGHQGAHDGSHCREPSQGSAHCARGVAACGGELSGETFAEGVRRVGGRSKRACSIS